MTFARTRRQLLAYLWAEFPGTHLNVFKEGARYVVRIDSTEYATYIRQIDGPSLDDWRAMVRDRNFPILA